MTTHLLEQHTQFIQEYFAKLGFEPEVTAIYLALTKHGEQSISQLARTSGVERTRIYRLSDELAASGLVEVITQYKKSIYKPAPIENVQIIIAKKEQQLKELTAGLDEIKHIFTGGNADEATKVQFYQGEDGAKQLFWNETKAKSEMLCILYENMQSKTNSRFFERWVRTCNERKIMCRGVVNQTFYDGLLKWRATHSTETLQYWTMRVIDKDTFPITHSTITYDNVTAHYNWSSNEVYGMEIYNEDIANTQRRYFELLWSLARPSDEK